MESDPASPPPVSGDFEGFLSRAAQVRLAIEAMREPIIVNHFDCDGLTSGAIACAFLESKGIPYQINTVRKLDEPVLDSIRAAPEVIFTDLGGGYPGVNELKGNVAIIDHHQTSGISKLQLNPHLFGFDGGTAACAATTAYWALGMLPEVAITGAVGDMQYPFIGLNRRLADDFISKGWLEAPVDLRFYGRMSRPLPQLLAFADEPFLPGLGGHEDRCAQFLENLGLGPAAGRASAPEGPAAAGSWRTYAQLSVSERKKLVGALAAYMAELSGGKYPADKLVGETYLFPRLSGTPELYDAGEFSTLLNACGRHNQTQVGIDVCLGRPGALEKARALLALHRRQLREGVEFAYKQSADWGPFLFLDARGVIDDGLIGVVAGMLYPGGRQKPILALSTDAAGQVKVSGRGTKKLVAAGLNLGAALAEACAATGGQGGGHAVAAGATLPPERLDEFLKQMASILARQLGSRA
jgi:single-stranded-DNA-specific exonuclease